MWNVRREPCDKCLTLENKNKASKKTIKKMQEYTHIPSQGCLALHTINSTSSPQKAVVEAMRDSQHMNSHQCQKMPGNSPTAPVLWPYNMIVSVKKKSQPAILVIGTWDPLLIWRNTSWSRSKYNAGPLKSAGARLSDPCQRARWEMGLV